MIISLSLCLICIININYLIEIIMAIIVLVHELFSY